MVELWRTIRNVKSRGVGWGEGGIVKFGGIEVILSAVLSCDLPRCIPFIC